MKQKNIAITGAMLAVMLIIGALMSWVAPAQAASPFPVPSGTVGKITRIAGDIYTVDTGSGVVAQVRIDASTVVIKGKFASASSLVVGDRVVVDPSFRVANPPSTAPGNEPGVRGTNNSGSTGSTGNSTEGQRPGSSSGSGSSAPGASEPGSGGTSAPPPGDSSAGTRPGSTTSQAPGDSSTAPGARNPITLARLIWAPQQGETLTAGKVSAAVAGKVTLQAGTNTFTALVAASTDVRLQQTTNGSFVTAAASDIQAGRALIILGTSPRNSSTITSKLVLIQSSAQGTR